MKAFNSLSISTRFTVMIAVILIIVSSVLTGMFMVHERDLVQKHARAQMTSGLKMLEGQIREHSKGIYVTEPKDGNATALHWTGAAITLSTRTIDDLRDVAGAELTLYLVDAKTGTMGRHMTSLRNEQGKRALRTPLDPASEAYVAIQSGQRFEGEVTLFGVRHLAIYEPVMSDKNNVVGAIVAAIPSDALRTAMIDGVLRSTLGALAMLVLSLLGASFLVRRMTQPILDLSGVIDRIAARDYGVTVTGVNLHDEIGRVARAVESLRDRLSEGAQLAAQAAQAEAEREQKRVEQSRVVSELEAALQRMADGQLTHKIESLANAPFPADYEPLRLSYNQALDRVGDLLAKVASTARELRDSSHEIAAESRELSSRAENQAATLEEAAAAINELTVSVKSTADQAEEAKFASVENRDCAEEGAAIVQRAIEAMQGIERSSEQITRIISVIDDIAFQTSLLALNAGVEAARAGDAGRGFAVVASEVRVLARRASESAKEIKTLISESSQQVGAGSQLVSMAGQSLDEIVSRAKRGAHAIAGIAVAASEQAGGIGELNSGIGQLDHATQQNSAMAEKTNAAASSLLMRADGLLAALSEFRLPGAQEEATLGSQDDRDLDFDRAYYVA